MALSSVYSKENKEQINNLNKAAKRLENNAFKPEILLLFAIDLEYYICQIGAFESNKINQDVVNDELIEAKFQADYIFANHYKNKQSNLYYSPTLISMHTQDLTE